MRKIEREAPHPQGERHEMMPIQKLLKRIRWDREFGRGVFEIGYEDHIEQKILRVPFRRIRFNEENRFSFEMEDVDGVVQTIPFHRIREVYKDGDLIWHRPYGSDSSRLNR